MRLVTSQHTRARVVVPHSTPLVCHFVLICIDYCNVVTRTESGQTHVLVWHLVPFLLPSLRPFLFPCLFVSISCHRGLLPQMQLGLWSAVSFSSGFRVESGRQTVSAAFWVQIHAPCDSVIAEIFRQSHMHHYPYWLCNIPVWYFSEKWQYGFELAKEVLLSHANLYLPTFSPQVPALLKNVRATR